MLERKNVSKQKLIVVSFDALIYEDLSYLRKKPSFRYMLEEGSYVERMKSIYPTLTYPCHVTMATGCYPDKHGVTKNTYDVTCLNPPWRFDHDNVLCEDILDACKKAGLKTAAINWPVTGNHKSVDYLMDECWPKAGAPIEAYRETLLRQGTPQWLLEQIIEPFLWLRVGRKQPQSSYYSTLISAEIIRKYQPDILLLHVANVDSFRHNTGVFSDQVEEGLCQCEQMLSLLIQATKDAGVFEETNFVITADHGQMNVARIMNLNCIFAQNGLIETDEDGQVKSYKAWCYPTGMSAQIQLSDPTDEVLYHKVYELLKGKRDEGIWGISEVYTRQETKQMHLDGDFSFVVETDGYTEFGGDWKGSVCKTMPMQTAGCIRGDHGFHPDKGPRPPFVACGPAIKKGVIVPDADLVDGAPTYAKILGVELPGADGRALTELLV